MAARRRSNRSSRQRATQIPLVGQGCRSSSNYGRARARRKVFTSGFGSPWCAPKVKDEAALILTREIQAGRSVRAFHDFAGENFGVHSSSVKVTKRPASVFSPVDSTQETKNAERSKIEEARCK
jgi:hypothetical protein